MNILYFLLLTPASLQHLFAYVCISTSFPCLLRPKKSLPFGFSLSFYLILGQLKHDLLDAVYAYTCNPFSLKKKKKVTFDKVPRNRHDLLMLKYQVPWGSKILFFFFFALVIAVRWLNTKFYTPLLRICSTKCQLSPKSFCLWTRL